MDKETELYIKGMNDMFEWVKSIPLGGSARSMLDLHLIPIEYWMEKVKDEKAKKLIY